jgi:hypothetical protein
MAALLQRRNEVTRQKPGRPGDEYSVFSLQGKPPSL